MKKRVLTLLLALAMIVSLAACGGGGSSAAGTYKLTEMNAGGISMDLEELASTARRGHEHPLGIENGRHLLPGYGRPGYERSD